MLKPADDRLDYGQILAPPEGYRCLFAVGTTYSLDLEALLAVPLALFLDDTLDSTLLESPISVLDGLRKSADKLALFCEAGQIAVPDQSRFVYSLLESSVFQIALKNDKSFHPKIWLLQYAAADGTKLYRLIVLSRNLTFDRSWDLAVVLEGTENRRRMEKNQPLIDFLLYLQGMATIPGKKKLIGNLIDALHYVHFDTGDKRFADFDFLPLGIDGYDSAATGLFETYHDLLVFSPFLSRTTVEKLDKLSLKNPNKTIITRRTEIPKLSKELLNRFECYCLKDQIVDGEEAVSDSDGTRGEVCKQDIHGKLYFKKKDNTHLLLLGSANCSENAFNGNVEFMLRLSYVERGFHIADLIYEFFGRNEQGFDERQNPFEKIDSLPLIVEIETDYQQQLARAIKGLCRARIKAVVRENQGRFDVALRFAGHRISDAVQFSIAALAGGPSAPIDSSEVLLQGLELVQLGEFYTITAKNQEAIQRRVIKIKTEGIPDERDSAVFKSVIKDQTTFLKYVAFLLSDDALMTMVEQPLQWERTTYSWQHATAELPALYEQMLRATANSPEKLQEIAAVINKLKDQEIVPPEFERLYKTFLSASRRIKRV